MGDKVTADDRTNLEGKIAAVREALNSDDNSRIESALGELQQATYDMSSRLYQQTAGQPGADGAAGSNGYHPGTDTPSSAPGEAT
jgi:molecular chaperone DnaK